MRHDLTPADAARFWAKVHICGPDDCWPWLRAVDRDGYGWFTVGTHRDHRPYRAHRIAFIISFGVIPDTVHVLHDCDNPPCCNPAHLWPGSNAENIRDRNTKGRSNLTRGARGQWQHA